MKDRLQNFFLAPLHVLSLNGRQPVAWFLFPVILPGLLGFLALEILHGCYRCAKSPENILKRTGPPLNAEFLFYLFMTPQNCEAIVGDIEERYRIIHRKFGHRRATFWFWWQTVISLFSVALDWVRRIAGEYLDLLSDVIVHFVFLAAFAVLSVGLEKVVEHFHSHGFELIVLRAIQLVFGVATIGPTAIWLVRDLKALWVRGQVKN